MPVAPTSGPGFIVVNPYAPHGVMLIAASALTGLDPYAIDDVLAAIAAYDGAKANEAVKLVVSSRDYTDVALEAANVLRDLAGYVSSLLRPPYSGSAAAIVMLYNGLVAVDTLADIIAGRALSGRLVIVPRG